MNRRSAVSTVLTLLASCWLWSGPAAAQQYPTKPVKVMVPLAAGGGLDTLMRQLAERMVPLLGQPVVVENRTGGGGATAATFLATQPPDGYAVAIFTSTTLTFTPLQGNVAYKLSDFAPVATLMRRSTGLISSAKAPFKGFEGLLAYGKAKGVVSFASQSQADKLLIERLGRQAGVRINVVPTRGSAEIRTMVMGGHVDFGISGALGFPDTVAGGPLQLLAVLDTERNETYREAPTLKEVGFDVTLLDHFVVVGPAKMSPAVAARLTAALHGAAADPGVQKLIAEVIGGTPMAAGPEATQKLLAEEQAYYARVLASAK